jgi:hypothetical protein
MSGQGKYTTYVPVSSTRNTLLRKLFNAKASNGAGVFYGKLDQADNGDAAKAAVASATAPVVNGIGGLLPKGGNQSGDPQMFPTGVSLSYGNAPDVSAVAWKNPGDPANPYVPDITSPGPGKTDPLDKDADPSISYSDLKPNYKPGTDADSTTKRIEGTGTTSPSVTSPSVASPIGDLTMGKSSV